MSQCKTPEGATLNREVGRVAKRILDARSEISDGFLRGFMKQIVIELVLPSEDPDEVATDDLIELVESQAEGRVLDEARWRLDQAHRAHQRELETLRREIRILRGMLRGSVAAVPPQD